MSERVVQLSVAVCVGRDGKVLLGKRSASVALCPGTWAFPGGRVEFGERLQHCCARELVEETGLVVEPWCLRFWAETEYITPEAHCVGLVYACRAEGTPEVREPDKCECWRWFDWPGGLPHPLMPPVADMDRAHLLPPRPLF